MTKRPGILFLSHADTDLLTLHYVVSHLPEGFPPVYGENLNALEEVVAEWEHRYANHVQVVVLRVLGSLQQLPSLHGLRDWIVQQKGALIVTSGLGTPDPELTAASTVNPAIIHTVTAYLQAGGRINVEHLLRFLADHFLGTSYGYEPPREQPEHGLYHPDLPADATLADWLAHRQPTRPTIGILFYRAHWLSGNLAFIDALVREIERRGANALPVFTTSLRDTTHPTQHAIRNTQHAPRNIPLPGPKPSTSSSTRKPAAPLLTSSSPPWRLPWAKWTRAPAKPATGR